jgi:hypothetical protein
MRVLPADCLPQKRRSCPGKIILTHQGNDVITTKLFNVWVKEIFLR